MANGATAENTCQLQKVIRKLSIPSAFCLLLCLGMDKIHALELPGPFTVKGSAWAQVRYYGINKGKGSRTPFVANINAQPVIIYKDWTINTRFVIGNYQTQFRDFNRYGISPQRKWMKFYLGHSTLNWSQFALESRPIFGAGAELNPGKWRLGLFAGTVNRASVQDTFRSRIFSPVYARRLIAAKVGYGDKDNYIDMILLSAADRASSLSTQDANGITPASNGVIAFRGARQFTKKLYATGDFALSSYTADTRNNGREELGPKGVNRLPGVFNRTNASSQFLKAFAAGIRYDLPFFSIKGISSGPSQLTFDYSRVEPAYQSMGLYFLVNDIERFRLGLNTMDAGRRVYLNLNLGYEHNDVTNTQFAKNKRLIEGVNITYRYKRDWNFSASVQNYAVRLLVDNISANDSLVINHANRNYSVSATGFIGPASADGHERARVMGMAGYQSGRNVISSTASRTLQHVFFQGSYTLAGKWGKWRPCLTYSVHRYNVFKTPSIRHIPGIGVDMNRDNKLQMHAETAFVLTWVSNKFTTFGSRNSFSGTWNLDDKHYLTCNVMVQPNISRAAKFVEGQADLRYGLRF